MAANKGIYSHFEYIYDKLTVLKEINLNYKHKKLIKMRAIFVIFPDRFEAFTSLKPFYKKYPEYKKHDAAINTALSRKKIVYEHRSFRLMRLSLNS